MISSFELEEEDKAIEIVDIEAKSSNMDNNKMVSPDQVTRKDSICLSVGDDPFAPREGKTLVWSKVNMILVRIFKKKILYRVQTDS